MTALTPATGTCTECPSDPRFTHSLNEHRIAVEWLPQLMVHIKTDAFAGDDRALSYQAAIDKFGLATTSRRLGRVLDAVEHLLRAEQWPPTATAGVAAYIVTAQSGQPGKGWFDIWRLDPRDARDAARQHIRGLAVDD
jgi:hypothetical protein